MYRNELEEHHRRTIWQSKRAFIKEHNRHANSLGYSLEDNKFSDMESSEINAFYKGLKMEDLSSINMTKSFTPSALFRPLDSLDWRETGAVTPVKDQRRCSSCWAFSTTGVVESQHFLKTKILVSLSEQNLMDCAGGLGKDVGCKPFSKYTAFNYIRDNRGIDTEESYPYEAAMDSCRFSVKAVGANVTGYVKIPQNESALLEAVTTIGPISVSIDASNTTFHHYNGGVYYNPVCSTTNLDHAVLVVGYGTLNGQDYWLVKNSWGEDWGLKGYIMMARNQNNNCGIITQAVYPTM